MKTGLFSSLKRVSFLGILLVMVACSSESTGTGTDTGADTDTDVGSDSMMEPAALTARYSVSFVTAWTSTTFPTNFPAGAHFSGLVGGTHNEQVRFWESGQLATDGVESMAETGSQSELSTEVTVAIADGKAENVLLGLGNGATDTEVLEFEISQNYPLVTLVSMVAPSPDWFVGVRDLSLFDDAAGDWKQTVVAELKVYDAGTEQGQEFSLSNPASQPVEPIALLSRLDPADHDFVNGVGPAGEFIARMTFVRIK